MLDKYFMSKKFNIDIREINEEFMKEDFRKEDIIDNYNSFNEVKYEDGEKLTKSYNNDLLEDKVEKINDIFKWFKDEESIKIEYLSNDTLREKIMEYFKDPTIKQLFNTYPKIGGDKKLYENESNHILNELGFEFVSKKKRLRDESGKSIVSNVYTIGYCKILKDYINRNEKHHMKVEEAFKNNLDEWYEVDENIKNDVIEEPQKINERMKQYETIHENDESKEEVKNNDLVNYFDSDINEEQQKQNEEKKRNKILQKNEEVKKEVKKEVKSYVLMIYWKSQNSNNDVMEEQQKVYEDMDFPYDIRISGNN